jgi:hypothetical protein
MLAVCLLEQIKPSLIVAARRRAVQLAREAFARRGNDPTVLALTISGDIARWPLGNPSLRLVCGVCWQTTTEVQARRQKK